MNRIAVEKLAKTDKVLGHLIKSIGRIHFKAQKNLSPYQALVESVIYQQLTGKAAETILGRVKALYPKKSFPDPEGLLKTTDKKLRAAGLSRAKTAYLKDIAAKTISGIVPTSRSISKMEDAEILERLTTIHGVGTWTVEMLLIFKLGRPDILPVTDYGIQKGFAHTFKRKNLPTPKELFEQGKKWRPYRTIAALYLWRATDQIKSKL